MKRPAGIRIKLAELPAPPRSATGVANLDCSELLETHATHGPSEGVLDRDWTRLLTSTTLPWSHEIERHFATAPPSDVS